MTFRVAVQHEVIMIAYSLRCCQSFSLHATTVADLAGVTACMLVCVLTIMSWGESALDTQTIHARCELNFLSHDLENSQGQYARHDSHDAFA